MARVHFEFAAPAGRYDSMMASSFVSLADEFGSVAFGAVDRSLLALYSSICKSDWLRLVEWANLFDFVVLAGRLIPAGRSGALLFGAHGVARSSEFFRTTHLRFLTPLI